MRRGLQTAVLAAALAFVLALWPGDPARAGHGRVLMDSHKNSIDISLSYDGDSIVFFGLNPDPKAKLVIKLVSQAKDEVRLSVKDRFGPLWMARRQYRVSGAPVMYKIISDLPLDKVVPAKLAARLGLGYAALGQGLTVEQVRGGKIKDERPRLIKAFISLKEAQGLYHVHSQPGRLRLIEGRLYSHYFSFPPTAGEGVYLAETFAIKKGRLVGYGRHQVKIRKVGLQAWITLESRRNPLLYGIFSVLAALLAGLGVGLIFKRGGHH